MTSCAYHSPLYMYYSLIVRFERNTRKYHEFIAGIVYECVARVNNATGNERVMFPWYCAQNG